MRLLKERLIHDRIVAGVTAVMPRYAHVYGVACIAMDMPGHGRSDGLFMYIESWTSFVDWAEDFCDTFVDPKVKEWSKQLDGRPLNVFGLGVSMGGGVSTMLVCMRFCDQWYWAPDA